MPSPYRTRKTLFTEPAFHGRTIRPSMSEDTRAEALRLGIIECEENNNVYKYWLNVIPKDWNNLDVREYKLIKNGAYVRGRRLFDYLHEQNRHSTFPYRKQIMLYNSEAFGAGGFDFNEIIQREQWDQMVIDRTHLAYMKRIMRKATGLYQDMEDTLYKFYAVEKELKGKEGPLVMAARRQKFVEYLANGLVMTDEDQYEWTILTAEGRTGTQEEEPITFGLRTKRFLPDLRQKHVTSMSEKEFDKLMDERIELLQNAVDSYSDICSDTQKDPVKQLMDYYHLDEDMVEQSEEVCKLFETIKEVLPTLMV